MIIPVFFKIRNAPIFPAIPGWPGRISIVFSAIAPFMPWDGPAAGPLAIPKKASRIAAAAPFPTAGKIMIAFLPNIRTF